MRRRQRGMTLIEVTVLLAMGGSLAASVGLLVGTLQAEERYAEGRRRGLDVLSKVVRLFEADVRSGDYAAGAVSWSLDEGTLRRDLTVLAEGVSAWDVRRDGDVYRARLALGRQPHDAPTLPALVTTFTVRARPEGGP